MTVAERLADWWPHDASQRSPIDLPATREDLARFLGECGVTMGAEVGVERGLYSETLCQSCAGLTLFAIDAWTAYRGYREHVTQAKLDGFRAETVARLARYRAQVVKAFSVDAARDVPDGSLDFVYLDGNHRLEQVVADLAAWVPKVRSGGIVAGHDFRRVKGGGPFHVVEALHAWTHAYRIAPWYVLRGDKSPTWLWVQP